MVTEIDIRDHVGQWLRGVISLRELEDWFVPATWDVHRSGDPQLEALVDEIELNLSEYSDRVISLDELREQLKNAVRSFESVSTRPIYGYWSETDRQETLVPVEAGVSLKSKPVVPRYPPANAQSAEWIQSSAVTA